jgi:hypothetical protein
MRKVGRYTQATVRVTSRQCMKILYLGDERDARVAAQAFRAISPNARVLWASDPAGAESWISAHPDVAAVVLEVQHDGQGSFVLRHVRRLGLMAPVVVVLPEGAGPPVKSLEAGADDYVTKTASISRQLPVVVGRAIERAQASGPHGPIHLPSDAPSESAALRLADLVASVRQLEHKWAAQRSAVEYHDRLDERIDRERVIRGDLEQQLAHAKVALEQGEQRHLIAMADAEARASERQAQYEEALARATVVWDMVDEQLRQGKLEVERARQGEAAAVARSEQLSHRETELTALLTAGSGTRATLEQRLGDAETALRTAKEQHKSAMAIASLRLAERETQLESALAQTAAARDRVKQQLGEVEVVLSGVRRDYAVAAADLERRTDRETELTALLTAQAATRTALEQRVADAHTALKEADERATRERLAATTVAAERQAEWDRLLDQERATRGEVEHQLVLAATALRQAEEQHQSAMAAASARLSEREAQFGIELAQAAAARDAIKQQLSDVEVVLVDAQREHALAAAEVERLGHRETELTGQLAMAAATRTTLERRLADAHIALKEADERATRERLAVTTAAAERQAEWDRQSGQERTARARVEQQFAHTEAALRGAEQRQSDLQIALDAARREHAVAAAEVERLGHRETELTALLTAEATTRVALERRVADGEEALAAAGARTSRERHVAARQAADREREHQAQIEQEAEARRSVEERLAAAEGAFADADAARTTLEQRLRTAETTLAEAEQQHRWAMASAATRLAQFENELSQTVRSRDEIKQRLSNVEAALAAARRDGAAAAAEVERLAQSEATLVASLRERDAQIEAQAARYASSLDAAERERAKLRDGFETNLAARGLQIAHLNDTLHAVTDELVTTRTRGEVLQAEADRVPHLLKQLEDILTETRVRFERSAHALCRCTRNGAIANANRTFAMLLGRRRPDELHGADFAAAVFESPDDLTWLLERALLTQAAVSTETTWRKRNGDRFAVRVSAFASSSGLIDIAADDLTGMRALEDRLTQAQRMESVGRLASEVAVTCSNLLTHVHRDAQEWLMTLGGKAGEWRRGEILFEDLVRATGHLQRLVDYSDEQYSALAPVDLHKVLRNLKPVLKHVAGDDVIVELPKRSSPLNVDLKAERVERLLVNLASYGRERMPFGGRLKIELGTVVVGRKFISQYPNVRQGPHALITVTEVGRTMDGEEQVQRPHPAVAANSREVSSTRPGVDLGTVQELIQECGGHLWMTAERSGNMTVKIRLPLRAWHREAQRQDIRVPAMPVPWAAL